MNRDLTNCLASPVIRSDQSVMLQRTKQADLQTKMKTYIHFDNSTIPHRSPPNSRALILSSPYLLTHPATPSAYDHAQPPSGYPPSHHPKYQTLPRVHVSNSSPSRGLYSSHSQRRPRAHPSPPYRRVRCRNSIPIRRRGSILGRGSRVHFGRS